jgi:fumarate hydratase, class II
MAKRDEKDGFGEVLIEDSAYYGINTARAIENFRVSGTKMPLEIIWAAARIKLAYAKANLESGGLERKKADAIVQACLEIAEGKFDAQFPLDVFQTGSGTSTNMNVNEVAANRAAEILCGQKGDKTLVHPNDDINMGQSSNDVFPSAIQISLLVSFRDKLVPSLETLHKALLKKADEFGTVVKAGRTHMMDALPITLGQEFSAYASQIGSAIISLQGCLDELSELPLGGTAVGSGFGTDPKIPVRAIEILRDETGLPLKQKSNLFAGLSSKESLLQASSSMKRIASALSKIAEDLRLMATGPRCGLAEIELPSLQAGSSIMAGKVNPVMAEMILMVSAQVIGYDVSNTVCSMGGRFELNTMMPLMAHNLLASSEVLSNSIRLFSEKCVTGIKADERRCRTYAESTPSLITALQPLIGYDKASELYKESVNRNVSLRTVVKEKNLLDDEKLDEIFDLKKFIKKG